ncbi:hypothetical protein EDC55_11645 [Allofrancisella inopinata]|uniref:Uncharacterized protein n=1 Tax=Allofrancisella inopinata TaxID=1085647 RepID=A0AAE6YJS8_9GAMM|nr:hypothetical protein [Allofrancisella inopinata]QIV96114.1 hypothetical protein E4K63_04430 [Allofrancisella inopinata]TDT69705.1 hypothetical protein EDC55_11645 [Allofrancisella inopinata]
MISEKGLFLVEARRFLEPLWLKAHASWGKIPSCLSSHMCRYSCIFLKQILVNDFEEKWEISSGRPFNVKDRYGYKDSNHIWHDHSWLQMDNLCIDITADQFGGKQIYYGKLPKSIYKANLTEKDTKASLATLESRVKGWINAWYNK